MNVNENTWKDKLKNFAVDWMKGLLILLALLALAAVIKYGPQGTGKFLLIAYAVIVVPYCVGYLYKALMDIRW